MLDGVPLLRCTVNEMSHLVRNLGVNLIAVGPEVASAAALYPQLRRLRFEGIEVLRPLTIAEFYSGRSPLDQVTEDALMQASMESEMPVVRRVKRLFDLLVALFLAVLFLPLVAVIAVLIKLSNPRGRVLYRQLRVGQFGKTFSIFKFRTMREDAERGTGAVWATSNDGRVTRLGRVLRKYRLDEIPQLLNILRGEMSMVGPRPERPSISAELARAIPYFEERENVMPGLTGWAQIRYPYGSTVEDARRKLEYDLYYIKHVSFSLDLQIILSTLRIMVLGKEWTV
jgi:exopolysaccharide biosynthesis polyprenyl glycosylphosphotransferase